MKLGDAKDIAIIALVLGALYFIWKQKEKIEEGADALAKPIADAIIATTLPRAVSVLGTVKLPSGVNIAMNGLAVNAQLEFTHLGKRYRLASRTGNYYTAVAA